MRVGVITFHNASNYGAALQAYATIEALSNMGYEAEIINYSNKYRSRKYSAIFRFLEFIRRKDIFGAFKIIVVSPGVFIRNVSFCLFYNKYLKVSRVKYTTTKQLKNTSFCYDAVIAGSDQIWSYINNGGDFSYLLDFLQEPILKISYASSFGMSEIPIELIDKYDKCLTDFNFLSVREKKGFDIIKKLTGRVPFIALDPVLLHDASFWSKIAQEPDFAHKSFDLYYLNDNAYRSHQLLKESYFDSEVKKINIGSFSLKDLIDKNLILRNATGPRSFIGYIKNARVVFTTSFHAVVFCLIFNTPFIVYLSGNEGRDSRILHILYEYDLSDRAISKNDGASVDLFQISFSKFNNSWVERRSECIDFLITALDSIKYSS